MNWGVILGISESKNKYSMPNFNEAKKRGKEEINIFNFEPLSEELKIIGKNKKYLIKTFGCQMNFNDSETIAGLVEMMGYEEVDDENLADLIILNTCAIREGAEDKVFGVIGRLKHLKLENPNMIIALAGCMSQEEKVIKKILKSYTNVDLIFGTHNLYRLPILIRDTMFNKETTIEVWSKEGDVIEHMPKSRKDGLKAYVDIMYGCNNFCTYCIVPYTRGKERSRKPEDILNEVKILATKGYKELTLLGQNVNAYGKDLDTNFSFADLLEEIRNIDIPIIRFTTSHPKDFSDELINVLTKKGNLVEHIHLPVQAGSTETLKKMGRKYTREQYLVLVDKIRTALPDAVLTTDIIVGFPGETKEQFNDTLSLVEKVGFDSAYTFIYSPREGTPAAKMKDDILEEEKKYRLQQLISLQNKISSQKNEQLRGKIFEVLVEGESKNNSEILSGRTRTNKLVNFKGDKTLIGQIVKIKITEPHTWSLNGEYIE